MHKLQRLKHIFLKLFERNKYRCLQLLKMPTIIACSSLVNPRVQKLTSMSGFHGCLSAPLKVSDIQDIIAGHLDSFVNQCMLEKFMHFGQNDLCLRLFTEAAPISASLINEESVR